MKKTLLILALAVMGCQPKEIVKKQEPAPFVPVEWPQSLTQDYVVVKGDCLWAIAGKSQIYSDPFAWPLIYKANRAQIKNPHWIEVGQKLEIDNYTPMPDMKAAVKEASDYKE